MQKNLYRRRGINPFSGERHETTSNPRFKTPNMENLQVFDRRSVKKELAKAGIKPVKKAALMLRITLTAIFFERNITEVIDELKRSEELRIGLQRFHLQTKYTASSANLAKFIKFVLSVINRLSKRKTR